MLVSFTTLPAGATKSLNIFSPDEKPYGLAYEDHIKNFWNWVISLPKDQNPWPDPTGKNCANEQLGLNSSVFYLSGNGGGVSERTCTVPAGKGLLIPVLVVEISDKEAPGASPAELEQIAKKDQDSVASMYLRINDKEYNIDEISKYRKSAGPFTVIFPEDPIFGATPGESTAAADGHYIITEPLSKGEQYTVHYKSSLSEPNFAQDIKYNITAQ